MAFGNVNIVSKTQLEENLRRPVIILLMSLYFQVLQFQLILKMFHWYVKTVSNCYQWTSMNNSMIESDTVRLRDGDSIPTESISFFITAGTHCWHLTANMNHRSNWIICRLPSTIKYNNRSIHGVTFFDRSFQLLKQILQFSFS